jgi:metal transporter CNNM
LLSNAAAMEALPLFLDEIVPSWAAILLSVSFVLIFGEVIPQALCTKDPLTIGAFFAWIVRFLMFVLAPIAYPLSKILDYVIGHDEAKVFFKRSELKTLIDMHLKPEAGPFHLTKDEGLILQGALNLKEKRVSQAMIPESEAFMVEHDFELNVENIKKIVRSGFSRIPVYQGRRNNIKGMLLVKQLLLVEPDHGFKVKDLTLRLPLLVLPNAPLHEILNKFQEGHSHLALVYSNVEMVKTCLDTRKDVPEDDHLLGLITIEDIMEELIQEEIADELDIDIDHLKSRISSGPNIPKFKGSLSKQIRVARSRSASLILEEMKRSPNMLLDSPRIAALKPTLGYLRLGDSVP